MSGKWITLAAVAVLLFAQPDVPDAAKKELERLQGSWVMVGLEIDGKDVPADKIEGTILTIKGDRYCTKVKNTEHECTIRVDPTKKPAAIDMIFAKPGSAPETCAGVYELKGEMLRIARGLDAKQKRPDQFMTWPGTSYFVVTWKRQGS